MSVNPRVLTTLKILTVDEAPVTAIGSPNRSPFLIVCDHASNIIPRALGTLGVSATERERHIAWDIGAAGVARGLAARLGTLAVLQNFSRLVVDCNRPPHVETAFVTVSEYTEIPGNLTLTEADRVARLDAIFHPYHNHIAAELDRRRAERIETALIAVHSFTPIYKGTSRPWHAGLLFNRDERLARPLIALLSEQTGLVVGENEPYSVNDESDYTIPVHAEQRGLPYAEIEIRQDLIADVAGQEAWAERLARVLTLAWERMER